MQKNKFVQIMFGVSVSILLGSASLSAQAQAKGRSYGVNNPFQIGDLPAGKLKDKLNKLSPKARDLAKAKLDKLRFHDRDIPYMRIDDNGGIYIADPVNANAQLTAAARTIEAAAALPVGIDVFKLHSNPGAANIVYLDFDGEVITNTAWNSATSPSYSAKPYDIDGITSSFSDTEKANIFEVWRRVAEDFAPFGIDVTTELPASFGPTVGRALITSSMDVNGIPMPANNSGGVAYIDVWGISDFASKYSPAFAYQDQVGGPDNIAEVVSHELGHNLGLSHDGSSTTGYYWGQGSGMISWAPIMGSSYDSQLTQWSKGEYADANQTEDDIAIITAKLNPIADDHSNTRSGATPLVIDSTGHVFASTPVTSPLDRSKINKGVISTRTDVDVFSFNTGAGNVVLQATPLREANAERGGNLDISLSLYDGAGNLIANSDPTNETDAGINTNLAAGTYYLAVDGVGSVNYTDYASLGQYFIEGVLPVAAPDTTAPNPNPLTFVVAPEAKDRSSIHMTASTATDESGSVQYYFACTAGGVGCVDSGWVASPDFTLTGLAANTSYSFTVKARDAAGNTTNSSAVATVNTLTNQAPVANADSVGVVNTSSVTVNVLANDTDPEKDPLAVKAVTQGANGTVSFTSAGVSYKPTSGFVGTDSFTYTINDNFGASATATVTVNVAAAPVSTVNRLPVAVTDSIKLGIGQTITIPVLNNDSDPDGDALKIISVKSGQRGYAIISSTGKELIYKAGYRTGSDTLSYTISDGRGGKASARVNVSIVR
ncbi:DVUA0089 family protein [uncultured Thiothrix sp.]|uniref:DVUA0089 family protein n=1 Tax=uncultured Thiothrix sp. TaxID=223185 RepID=UPI002610D7AA|nr:DVUA0089 family protein [uncultured Thiothrix sp.]